MKLKDAIAKRIDQLRSDNNLTVHGLSIKSGVANSTLTDIVKARNETIQIKHIYAICAGLNISLNEFFLSDYFNKETLTD